MQKPKRSYYLPGKLVTAFDKDVEKSARRSWPRPCWRFWIAMRRDAPKCSIGSTPSSTERSLENPKPLNGGAAVRSLTLETGTPEQMREEVQNAVRAGAPGGRFVLLPTSAPFMLPLGPRALAEATYKAAHEFGTYSAGRLSPLKASETPR